MEKEKLRQIIIDQKETFLRKRFLIKRDFDLTPYLKTKQIVLISGIRRCGKSSLLYLIHQELSVDFLYFNFDDERIIQFTADDFNLLYEIFLEDNPKDYVFYFDEIQVIPGWEKFLNRMYEKGIKIYVTGSNAKLLNSEIATTLTGRNLSINLMPFSFKEYLDFKGFSCDLSKLSTKNKSEIVRYFKKYFQLGGFPLVIHEENPELIQTYYNDIFYRDIITRYNVHNIEQLKELSSYLMSNCGRPLSYSKLSAVSNISSISLVKKYLHYFFNSFLFVKLNKFDYSVSKQILNPKKIYSIDTGFMKEVGFNFSENNGHFLETIVFLELKRRNQDIFYHVGKKECDFVIKSKTKISIAIQVCYNLNKDNEQREVDGLLDALTSYNLKEGLILTYDREDELCIKDMNIKIIPVWKWLLNYQFINNIS